MGDIMNDLEIAQKMINYGSRCKDIFHNSSFIYITTNEKINLYQDYLKNRKHILSVASSGDQIFNSILGGCNKIDAYDISRFPRYYVYLKKAGILSLTKEEFIKFFFNIDFHIDEYYDELYFKMRNYLETDYKVFWDGLLNFFDWSYITASPLFSSQSIFLNTILENNNYLNNFDEIKDMVIKSTINYITGDIFDIASSCKHSYDFINLSSIIYYSKNYKELLHKLPLAEDGISLTYLYSLPQEIISSYP